MSGPVGPVATCAGSSGGAQPPHEDPSRLPSHCESVAARPPRASRATRAPRDPQVPRDSSDPKGRGLAKAIDMHQIVAASGKINLEYDEEGKTWKALNDDGTLYDSAVGILTRDYCEPFHESWAGIPLHQRAQVFERMLDWFSIDYTYKGGILRRVVERDAMKCYRSWKCNLHEHFNENGGLQDSARARVSVPENIRDPVHWQRACDMFMSDSYQRRSVTNKANRGKKRSNSTQGRIPFARHRFKKVDIETKEPLSLIENWKDMYTRDGVWVDSDAEQTYHRLVERFTQASSADPEHVDEHAIMQEILGQRRGHMTGVGPSLPRKTLLASQPAAAGVPIEVFEEQQRVIQELRGQVQQQAASHGQLADLVSTMREMLTQLHPDIPLPVVPPHPPPPPASGVGAPSSSRSFGDDEAEDLDDYV